MISTNDDSRGDNGTANDSDVQAQGLQTTEQAALPPPEAWSAVAVRLLQGVLYNDEHLKLWEVLLSNRSTLTDYFAKLGLLLVVDEVDAMAYLHQPSEEEIPADYESVPRLFRRSTLSYEATILSVLLRDELRQFEEEDLQNERCVVAQNELLAVWQAYFPETSDEVKLDRSLGTALRKLEDLKMVRLFEKTPPSWEVRRIIKARLPLSELEQLRSSLVEAAQARMPEQAEEDRAEKDRAETTQPAELAGHETAASQPEES